MPRGFLHFFRSAALILLAVVGAVFLFRSQQTRDQRQAVRSLGDVKNLIVHYDYQRSTSGLINYDPAAQPRAPQWLRRLLGDEFLYNVAFLEVDEPYPPVDTVDAFLSRLPDCPVIYR